MLDQAEKNKIINSEPIAVTDDTFQSTVKDHEILVVDFWAPWCGPCRMVAPVIEELAAQYAGQVTFGKMNVDENQIVPSSFGVVSIPTIVVFHRAKAVERMVGVYPKLQIETAFRPYINCP